MSKPTKHAFSLDTTYVHLTDGAAATALSVGPEFWQTIGDHPDLCEGRMITLHRNEADWPMSEVHPEGDEIVFLLSGAIDLILEEPAGNRTIELRGRSACIVPQGVWHRAVVHEPGDVLHITRGNGTQHRPAGS